MTADDDLQTLLDLARAADDDLDGATFYDSSELDELVNTTLIGMQSTRRKVGFFMGKEGAWRRRL